MNDGVYAAVDVDQDDAVEHRIAVVGMSCRYPGAENIDEFWHLISEGRSGLTTLSRTQMQEAGVPQSLLTRPGYVPVAGLLNDPLEVDAAALGLSDIEAELMDPQQRLFLECSAEALDSAGLGREGTRGSVGVYAGQSFPSYLVDNLGDRFHPRGGADPVGNLHVHGLNVSDYLPARVAWQLGLTGPTVAVGATCATSLVAVHLAVNALLSGECDTALAGGASLRLPQDQGYLSVPDGPFSADGMTRSYGAEATGTVFTQGVGVVVLRRLSDALADGDPIHAVVLGSAVGNDGPSRAGFSAPSVDGQVRVLSEAFAVADVHPEQVGLIEGHGTGTRLGDPIELRALNRVFGHATSPWCSLGSVKSMIGHTDAAAGIAGFIKAVLAVENAVLPPTLYADDPGPELPLDGSALKLATTARRWSSDERIAGVSSFGIGGNNAHVVLAAAPCIGGSSLSGETTDAVSSQSGVGTAPLLVSAADRKALERRIQDITTFVDNSPGQDHARIASTLARGIRTYPWRQAVIAGQTTTARRVPDGTAEVVAVMPGGGAQFPGMAAGLYAAEPTFAASLDVIAETVTSLGGADPRIFALDPTCADGEDPRTALPALAAVELAYLDLLADYGVTPDRLLGHSLGEYVAAVGAGAMERKDALRLVIERSRLLADLPSGGMASVAAGEDVVSAVLRAHPDLDLAAVNGPQLCVVAGPSAALSAFEEELRGRGIQHRRLRIAVAGHSRMVDPVIPRISEVSSHFTRDYPVKELVSGMDGRLIEGRLPEDYWARHLRQTVRLDLALDRAAGERGNCVIVQVGPGGSLVSGAAEKALDTVACWPSKQESSDPAAAREALLRVLIVLWSRGVDIDMDKLVPSCPMSVLPRYPWQRRHVGQEHRLAVTGSVAGMASGPESSTSAVSAAEPFQYPMWRQDPESMKAYGRDAEGLTVVLSVSCPPQLLQELQSQGFSVRVDGQEGTDGHNKGQPDVLVHVSAPHDERSLRREVEMFSGYARTARDNQPAAVLHVTLDAEDVIGTEVVNPYATATSGLVRVLGQEAEGLVWSTVDLESSSPSWDSIGGEVLRLARFVRRHSSGEAGTESGTKPSLQPHRALRGRRSWTRSWEPWQPEQMIQDRQGAASGDEPTAEGTVWVILGGTGSVGTALATGIEREYPNASVVLVGRCPITPGHPSHDTISVLRRTSVENADVSEPGELTRLLTGIRQDRGRVDVVIHAPVQVDLAPLAEIDAANVRASFGPKVTGAVELAAALDSLPSAPRVLLISSAAGTIGGFGLATYISAGRFLDGLAQARGWTTIDLDRVRLGTAEEAGRAAEISMRHAIDLDDAVTSILRIVATDLRGYVAASPTELNTRTAYLDTHRAQYCGPLGDGTVVDDLRGWERVVADVWESVLGRKITGRGDDFFAMGGHSLLATRVLADLRDMHGVELRLKDLLSAPTVAECAQLIERRFGKGSESPGFVEDAEGTAPVDRDVSSPGVASAGAPFGLTRIQHAYWLGRTRGVDPSRTGGAGVGCHFYLEYDVSELDEGRYRQAWRAVVSRHPMLRAVITTQGMHHIIELPEDWGPTIIDLSGVLDVEHRLEDIREQWSTRVADPSRWPLVVPVVVRLPGGRWRVLLSVDVLVCDSASWMIVDREIQAKYLDPEADLGSEPPRFEDCLQLMSAKNTGRQEGVREDAHDRWERAREYWQRRVQDFPDAPAITRGTRIGDNPIETGRPHFMRLKAVVPRKRWSSLCEECRQRHVTPTSLVLSTYRDALAGWSGQDRFAVTVTVFDRPNIPGADAVVGEFSSMILHEADLSAIPDQDSRWERAQLTQDRLMEDLDHRDFGGLEVLTELSRARGRSTNIPVVFTSMLGLDKVSGTETHDHEWLGKEIYGVSQTPQVWLDHQAFEHNGDLVLQWDVCDTVIDLDSARERFEDYVDSFAGDFHLSSASSDTKEAVTLVWADLLGLSPEDIGDDTFLALGGDSLMAVRMAAELRRHTGVGIPLNQIRADVTVDEIVDKITSSGHASDEITLQRRAEGQSLFPLLPLQQGYFVGMSGGWDLSYRTAHVSTDVELTLPDDCPDPGNLEKLLCRAVDAVSAHQPMVRAQILSDGTQRIRDLGDPAGITPAKILDLRAAPDPEGEFQRLRQTWATHGPDPRTGPGVSVDVVLLGDRHARLHVSSSLLIMDGWSASIYDRELFAQLSEPGTVEAPLDLDFGDYVNTVLSDELREERELHRRWWWERISDLPDSPRLLRRTEGEITSSGPEQSMVVREFRLTPLDWQQLRENCLKEEITPATALMGVFAAVLRDVTGQSGMLLNTMQHNRIPVHPDVDRLIGAFSRTALLPVRLRGERVSDVLRNLATDTEHYNRRHLVTAVDIGREIGRRTGSSQPVAPVVFQSTLGMSAAVGGDPTDSLGDFGTVHLSDYHQDIRTPQVELEMRFFELDGELIGSMASVDRVLAVGLPALILDRVRDEVEALLDPQNWTLPWNRGSQSLTGGYSALSLEKREWNDSPGMPHYYESADECTGVGSVLLRDIRTLWQDILGLDDLPDPADDFFSLGGDSLFAVRMLSKAEAELGLTPGIRDFLSCPTPLGLASIGTVSGTGAEDVSEYRDSLLDLRTGVGRPIFLLHPSGGDILCYLELARLMDTTRPVVAVSDPGLDGRPMPPSVDGMVDLYFRLIRDRQPTGQLTLAGWSMGGTVAHELARRVVDSGGQVDRLIMFDSNSPSRIIRLSGISAGEKENRQRLRHLRSMEAFLDVADRPADVDSSRSVRGKGRIRDGSAPGRDDDWRTLARHLIAEGVVGEKSLDSRFEVFRRHMESLADHEATILDPSVPVLLFRATVRSPRNSGEGMGVDDIDAHDLGWTPWVRGYFSVEDVRAHHYSLLRHPTVEEVAMKLSRFLREPVP